jgi:hypothetical protein
VLPCEEELLDIEAQKMDFGQLYGHEFGSYIELPYVDEMDLIPESQFRYHDGARQTM